MEKKINTPVHRSYLSIYLTRKKQPSLNKANTPNETPSPIARTHASEQARALRQPTRLQLSSSPIELISFMRSGEHHVARYEKLSMLEILKAKVHVSDNGQLCHLVGQELRPLEGSHLYVLLPNKTFVAYPDNELEHRVRGHRNSVLDQLTGSLSSAEIKHMAFAQGGEVICAGHLEAEGGYLKSINNFSGHYTPKPRHLENLKKVLEKNYQLDLTNVQFNYYSNEPKTDENSNQKNRQVDQCNTSPSQPASSNLTAQELMFHLDL